MCGGDEGSWGHHGRGRRRQHLVDQRGFERSFDAAADQVTQRDLEHVFTCCFAWEEEMDGERREQRVKSGRRKEAGDRRRFKTRDIKSEDWNRMSCKRHIKVRRNMR